MPNLGPGDRPPQPGPSDADKTLDLPPSALPGVLTDGLIVLEEMAPEESPSATNKTALSPVLTDGIIVLEELVPSVTDNAALPDVLTDGVIVLEELVPDKKPSAADEARTLDLPSPVAPPHHAVLTLTAATGDSPLEKALECYESFTGLDRLDAGGQGTIYRARQAGMNREVVIKWAEGNSIQSIRSEAMTAGSLEHPNIVPVHLISDAGDEDRSFFAMKWVVGVKWHDLLHPPADDAALQKRAAAMTLDDHLQILLMVCNAVAFAHSRKIAHCDLKPLNVMIGEYGEVQVMDWGTALDISDAPPGAGHAPHKSLLKQARGTVRYMAPEMVRAEANLIGPRTDVHLLGAILYEIIYGMAPYPSDFRERSIQECRHNAAELEFGKPKAAPQKIAPAVRRISSTAVAKTKPGAAPSNGSDSAMPQELVEICRKALSRYPAERHADAQEFGAAIRKYLSHRASYKISQRAWKLSQEQPAGGKAIPIKTLGKAAALHEEALALSSENKFASEQLALLSTEIERRERNARLQKWSARGLAATVLIGVTTAYFLIRAEKDRTEIQRNLAVANEGRANEQKALAEKSEANAKTQKEIALRSLHKLVFSVQERMAHTPALQELKISLLKEAQRGLTEIADERGVDTTPDRVRAASFGKLGEMSLELGDPKAALEFFRKGHALFKRLAAESKDPEAPRDLAVSFEKLGNAALELGDTTGALESYHSYLAASERLAEASPQNAQAQSDLGVSFDKLGDVTMQMGNSAAALEYHKKALGVRERLAAISPQNARIQHDLALSYDRLGNSSVELGDIAGALAIYKKSLAIREQLAAADPENQPQRDLLVSYSKVGDMCLEVGETSAALDFYKRFQALSQKLARADPKNVQAQRDQSVAYNKLGDISLHRGDLAASLDYYKESLAISERTAAANPGSTQVQRDLFISCSNVGSAKLRLGDPLGALALYQMAHTMSESLAADNKNAQAQRDYFIACSNLGDINLQMRDVAGAISIYTKSLAASERLAADNPQNAQAQRDVAVAYLKLAKAKVAGNGAASAMDLIMKGLVIRERLAAASPINAQAREDVYVAQMALAETAFQLKDFKAAVEWCEKGIATARGLERDGKWPPSRKNEMGATLALLDECKKARDAAEKPK